MAIKVKLRKKSISGKRQSLYLDFYPAIPHPKTGKPIHKKDDKKVKETKTEKKVDPKAIPPVVIVPEIHWNIESTDEHPDPNHGPSEVFIEA